MAAPSFPDVTVSGAVHHYVKTYYGTTWYLGTAEVTPQVQVAKYRQLVHNDIAGKTLPIQKTYDGEAAQVSVLLTRFSELAYDAILNSGFAAGLTPVAGSESRWSRGALSYGQEDFQLWQVFENFFNPVPQGVEIGRYWPRVTLESHDYVALGTQAKKLMLVFDCQPLWLPYTTRGWMLYDWQDNANFPNDVRTPQ